MSTVFFSYSHKDELLRDELETHLATLKRQSVISTWHDRRLVAGDPLDSRISAELERADIILLLVSADFLASEYCYSVEMSRAVERHKAGEARVIPVILRPCDWHETPFGGLLAAPQDGKPITKWPDRDEAFLDVTKAIRAAAKPNLAKPLAPQPATSPRPATSSALDAPRSSNLRLKKIFTQLDKDTFQQEAFDFMARFFETSLSELGRRNQGIEGRFQRIDATKFTATVYRNGQLLAQCQIRHSGGGTMNGIAYSMGNMGDNSFNELMSVDVGDQSLGLKSLGMQMTRSRADNTHLSFEGAAEYYWSLFIEPLQR